MASSWNAQIPYLVKVFYGVILEIFHKKSTLERVLFLMIERPHLMRPVSWIIGHKRA